MEKQLNNIELANKTAKILTREYQIQKSSVKQSEADFNIKDVPIGTCFICKKTQTTPAQGGIWLTSDFHKWICYDCKYKNNIRNYPMECEWCTYRHVKWYQGHTYSCPRCKTLKLRSPYSDKEIEYF